MAVFFAAVLFVFIGMTGLAVDYGFATLERRVLQNAVDAAAQSGATNLSMGVSAAADVQTMVTRNNVAVGTTVVCDYIDNSNVVTGSCSGTPSGTTSGVRVSATSNRPTYFMRVLGIPTVAVSANSMARVSAWNQSSALTQNASNTLFLVCGWSARVAGNPPTYHDILTGTSGNYGVNGTAVGKTFVIHGPQIADCGIHDSAFKGLNSSTGPVTLADWIFTESGVRAGPVAQAVPTPGGCAAGLYSDDTALDNCNMLIPIFTQDSVEPTAHHMVKVSDDWKVWSVMWLMFEVHRTGANEHTGTLLSNAPLVPGPTTLFAPWTKNTSSMFTAVRPVQ
jgi:Flp pilus assembly protein TadG